tara:strand:- start:7015 stop:9132 length:2118 start_codon:yes stop_codon:yes gene_type:complete
MDLDDLLKSIREEGPSKGGAIAPAKFFGEDRYQAYLEEITTSGTIGGEALTSEERKEGFKKRNDKIGFETFVEKVLAKKKAQTESVGAGKNNRSLGKGSAIVKSPGGSLSNISSIIPPPISEETEENLEDILKGIDSIRETLAEEKKLEEKKSKKDRRDDEKERRAKKEKRLESNIFKGIAKTVGKVLSPVKSIFDKIMNYLTTVFLGRVAMSIFEWFSDKENTDKIKTIFRFVKDWWPAMLGGLILFGGALLGPVGLIAAITGLAIAFVPKLFDATKQLLGFGEKTEKDAKKAEQDLKAAEEGVEVDSLLPPELQEAQSKKEETENLKEPVQMKGGGKVPGSGPNEDTIPAMLAPGEFVMSRGAVNKYGTDTLAGMNAMGGGTNRPMIRGGVTYAQGGGHMGGEPGGRTKEKQETDTTGGGGRAWWDVLGWAGTGKPKTTDTASSGGDAGNYDSFAKSMIKVHEGKRLEVYQDSLGFPTVGYGHLIDSGSPVKGLNVGDTITDEKANQLFDDDYEHHKKAAEKIPGYEKASGQQKAALIDLTFNMGPAWASGFPSFKKAFAAGDYETAGNELMDSAWYGQVGRRAPTIVSLIKGKGTGGASYLKDVPTSSPASSSIASSVSPSSGGSSSPSSTVATAAKFRPATTPPSVSPPPMQSPTAMLGEIADLINSDFSESPQSQTSQQLPQFAADFQNSLSKIKTLGVL